MDRSTHRTVAQVLPMAIGLVFVGIAVSGGWPFRGSQGGWAAALLLLVGGVMGLAHATRLRTWGQAVLFESPTWRFALCAAVIGSAASARICRCVFAGVPRLDDSVAAVFQARIFASGKLTLPLPEFARFFEMFGVLGEKYGAGRWCSMYPPGQALLMVPGVWLDAVWLVNPLLLGMLVASIILLGEELMGRRVGRIAGLMALCSPYLVAQGGMHLSHVPTALAMSLTTWAALKLIRTGRTRYGAIAGLAWGMGFLCRPVTSMLVGAVVALGMLAQLAALRRAWKGVLVGVLLAVAAGGVLAAWHYASTGDASLAGHQLAMGDAAQIGFGPRRARFAHDPAQAVEHTLGRIREIDHRLLGWPVPSMLIVMLPLLLGRARGRELWLLLPWVALLGFFALFWYWEEFYPARYTFAGLPFLFVLAARGTEIAADQLQRRWPWGKRLIAAGVAWGCLFSLCVGFESHLNRFGPHHGDREATMDRCLAETQLRRAVVYRRDFGRPINYYYATDFLRNDLEHTADVLFVNNLREENVVLMRAMPDRTHYLYSYDRDSGHATLDEMTEADEGYDFRRVWSSTPADVP